MGMRMLKTLLFVVVLSAFALPLLAAGCPSVSASKYPTSGALTSMGRSCNRPVSVSVSELQSAPSVICPAMMPVKTSMSNGCLQMTSYGEATPLDADADLVAVSIPVEPSTVSGTSCLVSTMQDDMASLDDTIVLIPMSVSNQQMMVPCSLEQIGGYDVMTCLDPSMTGQKQISMPVSVNGQTMMMPVTITQVGGEMIISPSSSNGKINMMSK